MLKEGEVVASWPNFCQSSPPSLVGTTSVPTNISLDHDHHLLCLGDTSVCMHYACFLQEASVFLFEKKSIERYSRHDRDAIMETLRCGVQQLTKLRHPKILAVIQPLEESRYGE